MNKRTSAQIRDDSGVALVSVLVLIATLSFIVVSMTRQVHFSALYNRNQSVTLDQDAAIHSMLEITSAAIEFGRMPTNGEITISLGQSLVTARATAESARIDLNVASEDMILGLMLALFEDPQEAISIAAKINDWRDEDDLRRLGGAEKNQYEQEGLPYDPANGYFLDIAELQHVMGISAEVYDKIKNWVTISTREALPSASTLPFYVREAVQYSETLTNPSSRPVVEETRWQPDPNGLYRVDIEVVTRKRFGIAASAVLLIDPETDGNYSLLSFVKRPLGRDETRK